MESSLGTNDVEKCASKLCKQNVKKGRNVKLIRDIMKSKVEDAEYDAHMIRKEFIRKSVQYNRVITKGSGIDIEFKNVMKREVEDVWKDGKKKNVDKIENLKNRYKPAHGNGVIRNIEYSD